MTVSAAKPFERLAVVGAGAWGTALAISVIRGGRIGAIALWAHEPDVVAAINGKRVNDVFLPGIQIPPGVTATTDLAAAVGNADVILIAVPAQHVRTVVGRCAGSIQPGAVLVLCAKGIELSSGKLMSDVLAEASPTSRIAVLSGPTFAAEVAAGKPTAVTLACRDRDAGGALAATIGSASLRPYLTDDVVGTQIGGAVKNVIAIACGIIEGRHLGDNARAALIARGLSEMTRLGVALGGRRETLMGLSGLGDLALTCNGQQSRNLSLGLALGRGKTMGEALAGRRSVVEGVDTAPAVLALAKRHGVEMPIVSAVDAIVHRGADINRAIASLLERPFKSEE